MPDESSALRDQKRESDLLGLDLEAVMSLLTGCWEPNADALEERDVFSTTELSLAGKTQAKENPCHGH